MKSNQVQAEPFHKRLRRLRKGKGLSMKALAQKAGIPQTTYRDWEYGGAIQGQPYLKLASVLEVNLYELLGSEQPKKEALLDLIEKLDSLIKEIKKVVLPLI